MREREGSVVRLEARKISSRDNLNVETEKVTFSLQDFLSYTENKKERKMR